ncbi:hypothetical protein D3Z36_00775 [Lachnospiraceae bacterium]|nr:hypothetical protein [Lachnospiraceae bacterium]
MRSFKEQLEKDFDDTFFNLDEFAELHTIDGNEIPVVVDNEALIGLNMGKSVETDGIFTDSIIIFVQRKYLDYEPVIGQVIDFDGVTYPIDNVLSDTGGYTMILRGNEG